MGRNWAKLHPLSTLVTLQQSLHTLHASHVDVYFENHYHANAEEEDEDNDDDEVNDDLGWACMMMMIMMMLLLLLLLLVMMMMISYTVDPGGASSG